MDYDKDRDEVDETAYDRDEMPSERMPYTDTDFQRFIGYGVVDSDGDKFGTIETVWADQSGEPAFLGIRTGWLGLGKMYVVPTQGVHLSEHGQRIRLPYTKEVIKEAPTYLDQAEIDQEAEQGIRSYYLRHGLVERSGQDTAVGAAPAAPMPEQQREGDERTIQLKEEEVTVGKRQVEAGGVRLRKIVRVETVNQPVELLREDVVIERVPAHGEAASDAAFDEDEIYIPLRREEAVVAKKARVKEEVRVRKTAERKQEQIEERVRSEDVEVENMRSNPAETESEHEIHH
jgi:uncharacterized protein (TIGR02271 family)